MTTAHSAMRNRIRNCPHSHSARVAIGFPVVQAALSGYSDWPMRLIARRHGASYALCEVMLDQFLVTVKDNRNRNRHFLHISRRRAARRRAADGRRAGAVRRRGDEARAGRL